MNHDCTPPTGHAVALVLATWTTGPDAGEVVALPPGRHVVGRAATAGVRCDDPSLQPHHILLEVQADGAVSATQLAGRVPVRTTDGAPLMGRIELPGEVVLEVGGSTLTLQREVGGEQGEPGATVLTDGTVVRAPRVVPRWQPAELTPPTAPLDDSHPVGGLLPAALGLAGAAVIALVLHQPMFLLFGALGSVVAVGSWIAQHVGARRTRARRAAAHAAEVAAYLAARRADRDAFVAAHLASVPTTVTARRTVRSATASLWARRAAHDDAFRVSVGLGSVAASDSARLDGDAVPHLPVATDLGPAARLAVVGSDATALAFALVAQLAAQCGPADLRLVVVTEHPDWWRPLRTLPHLQLPDGTSAIVAEDRLAEVLEQLDGDERAHLVIVTDHAAALATRTGPLRRALGHDAGALVAVLAEGDGVPHLCTAVLTLSNGPVARWVADTSTSLLPEPVRVAGMGRGATARLCAALGAWRDPEDALAAARLPRQVDLAALVAPHGWSAEQVLAGWSERHPPLRTPIGVAGDGIVDIDLDRDGPHALLAGTTGSGKSELLRSLVLGLAVAVPPWQLQLVLVDYKGGATFDALTALPHVAGVVTDLDDQLADRALRSLHAELRRREATLREHGVADLAGLRARATHVTMPRLVVVVDEFAALVAEQPDFLHALVGVAQRGRSLGVHLVLATQRPQGVISDDIRANTNLRIALRLHDSADAVDVVGDTTPARLPRGVPGRAVMRLGADEHLTFQTAHLADTAAAVAAVCAAARQVDADATWPAPWTPPLPATLTADDVPEGAIGWCDDPDRQRRVPLQWSPADGSVVVAGSPGSGVTGTLRTLVAQALRQPDTHVHVLTAATEHLHPGAHPRLVSVRLHETERVHRLLHRLRMPDLDGARRVVVIDGLETVRRTLDHPDSLEAFDALDEVLASACDTVVVGTAQPSALPVTLLARCANRWVLHLHDAHDALTFGVTVRQVPPPMAGRVHVAATGLAAQLVHPAHVVVPDGDTPGHGRVEQVGEVPAVVAADQLGVGWYEHGELALPVGLDFTTGRVHHLVVPDGDHVLVLGGSRTGRSTTLTRLTAAWRAARPTGRVVALLPRRSAFDTALADVVHRGEALPSADDVRGDADSPLLVVCDDADLLDDTDGVLTALAAGRTDGVTVLAAARPDALRSRYGHWTMGVRHARLGLLAAGGGDTDADLLGTVVPRRLPVRARPGLTWVIDHGGHRLVQVALDAVAPLSAHAGRH